MAAQETFFNYGDKLSSKRFCETFGILNGVGPVSGFGSAKVVDSGGNKLLVIYPYASGDENSVSSEERDVDPIRYIVRSRINSHRTTSSMGEEPMQSVIARDGTIWRFGQGTITVPIEGTPSNEVFLFAHHEHIPEKVDNPVTLRAIFNNSAIDFYQLYKKSRNPYYPSTDSQYLGSLTGNNDDRDPFLTVQNSYSYLDDAVAKACTYYANSRNSMVLVGVYGTGNDEINNRTEYFAIVPYQGQGLSDIPYSYGIHNYLVRAINRVEGFIFRQLDFTNPSTGEKFNNITSYINYVITAKTKELADKVDTIKKQVDDSILQPGSIILWDGLSIPNGWEEYSKASGRVVIGYKEGGITLQDVNGSDLTVLRNNGEIYNPTASSGEYSFKLSASNLPKHRHGLGIIPGRQDGDQDRFSECIGNFDDRDKGINGAMADFSMNPFGGIIQGAVFSGYNALDNDPNHESTVDTVYINKLIPAITLRYIRKKSY